MIRPEEPAAISSATPAVRKYAFNTAEHRAAMRRYRAELLDFYQPRVANPEGGFYWLSRSGEPLPEKGAELWIGARMTHCFSLAHLEGRRGARQLAEHGVEFYLEGAGRDRRYGGWFAHVQDGEGHGSKDLYGLAHIIMASATATAAGISGAAALLGEALDLLEHRYWEPRAHAGIDSFDERLQNAAPYRGMNANMHLTEALLAAFEATGERELLQRAEGIAWKLVGVPTSQGEHRIVEHYDAHWQPLPQFNADKVADPFKPFGSTPGHWLEWAKLALQIHGVDATQDWCIPAARLLFAGALADGWLPGFAYTVDWEGKPVVADRFWWALAEGIGAAYYLGLAADAGLMAAAEEAAGAAEVTGSASAVSVGEPGGVAEPGNAAKPGGVAEPDYPQWYEKFWMFADEHFMDHAYTGWFCELDDNLQPVSRTWEGKPDLYHIYQAALYCETSLHAGFTPSLRQQSRGRA